MLGNIIEIDDNLIKVKMNFDINSQSSLMNLNVIFVDGNSRFVGEIIGIKNDNMIITLLGEIVGETFFLSTLKKPSFKATPRLIKAEDVLVDESSLTGESIPVKKEVRIDKVKFKNILLIFLYYVEKWSLNILCLQYL